MADPMNIVERPPDELPETAEAAGDDPHPETTETVGDAPHPETVTADPAGCETADAVQIDTGATAAEAADTVQTDFEQIDTGATAAKDADTVQTDPETVSDAPAAVDDPKAEPVDAEPEPPRPYRARLKIPTVLVEAELMRQRQVDSRRKRLYAGALILALMAAVVTLMLLTVTPVIRVSGTSMEDNYHEGDMVLLEHIRQDYEPGDVIAFEYDYKVLIKRVIAVAGDTVEITPEGRVLVNGQLLEEDYVKAYALGSCDTDFPLTVPDNCCFVMGDNREVSIDSRSSKIGCIRTEDILGEAVYRLWPIR